MQYWSNIDKTETYFVVKDFTVCHFEKYALKSQSYHESFLKNPILVDYITREYNIFWGVAETTIFLSCSCHTDTSESTSEHKSQLLILWNMKHKVFMHMSKSFNPTVISEGHIQHDAQCFWQVAPTNVSRICMAEFLLMLWECALTCFLGKIDFLETLFFLSFFKIKLFGHLSSLAEQEGIFIFIWKHQIIQQQCWHFFSLLCFCDEPHKFLMLLEALS